MSSAAEATPRLRANLTSKLCRRWRRRVVAPLRETFTTHYSPLTPMNYIRHLNTFFSHVKTDTRLTSSHVSLYMALFQYWNFNRFQNPFSIYRENIMQLS